MLALGCDHGGYELMQEVKKHLENRGIAYHDFGCSSTESVDYPICLLYTSPSPRDGLLSRMPSSA